MSKTINRRDLLAALILLIPPLLLFWSVTIGSNTLLPVDNLFTFEPWLSYRAELNVGLPQNQLLSDLILENYVWKKFIRESIATRQIPLWNPYILSGQPFLANGQHSALYPFSLIFYILPLPKAYGWFTVSQLWLAGLFMYIFLRTLRVNRLGALVAGLTYSLSGFFITRVVFTMILAGAIWLPLILALIEIIIRKQEAKGLTGYSPIPYVTAGAITLGLQTLAGHVEITYYTLLVSGFYALGRLLILWRRQQTFRFAFRLGLWLLVMVGLGLTLGAVQLVPMYEIVSQNFRDNSASLEQVRAWALPARRLISFVIPDFFGSPAHHSYFDAVTWRWQPLGLNANGAINPLCPYCAHWETKSAVEAGAYMGILPLALAALAIFQAFAQQWKIGRLNRSQVRGARHASRQMPNGAASEDAGFSIRDLLSLSNLPTFQPSNLPIPQSPIFIFTLLALFSLLFAFGTPLYALLFYGLPGWNQLHSPFRWIFPYTLSVSVLAGFGAMYLDRFVSARRGGARERGSGGAGEQGSRGAEAQGSILSRPRNEVVSKGAGEQGSGEAREQGSKGAEEQGSILSRPRNEVVSKGTEEQGSGEAGEQGSGGAGEISFSPRLDILSLYLGWLLFWSGLAGIGIMLIALWLPMPFIQAATFVFDRSGLAQNAFADGRQFFGYQWPNFFKFFLMVMAAGAVLRITRCPIFTPPLLPPLKGGGWGGVNAWKPLALIIITVDLLLAGWGFNPSVDPALLDFKPDLVSWLEERRTEDPFFRINSFDTPEGRGNKVYQANVGMFNHIFDARGYDSIIPAQYVQFMQLIQQNGDMLFNRVGPIYTVDPASLDSALLDLLGARYILTTVDIDNPNYELVYDREMRVYENSDALPRAFVVAEAVKPIDFQKPAGYETMPQLEYALRSLNPREQILLDGENNGLGRNLTPDDAVELSNPIEPGLTISDYTPNEIKIRAQLNQPGWLVLADTYFSGWRAYATQLAVSGDQLSVSGEQSSVISERLSVTGEQSPNIQSKIQNRKSEIELTIHRANGNFRAVYLQPGAWQIRFRYSPRSFQLGLYGSFLALATLAFLLGYWSWGKLYRESESDSAIKRIAKNSLVPMVMALSNRLIDFAFALLMLRILQPEGAGKYAFAVAFIGLTEIVTRYGLGTLVTREVAANQAERNRYLANVSILRLYLWLAALPVMTAILGIYLIYGEITTDIIITIALLAIGTLLSNLSDGLTAIFYAHEKAEYPAGIASITTLSRVSVGALVLILGWGIIGLAGASLLANLVAFVTLSYILLTKIYRPSLESDRSLQQNMMAESLPLMINHLLSTIFFRIDVFILKPTWGDESVGFYNAAYKYVDGINIIPQYFTLAIFPLMSRFAASSRDSLIRAYILSLRLLLMLALPIAVGTPFIARELILFLAGDGFLPDSMIVLQLLIWFLPFSFINQVTQYALIAINQQRHLTRAFVIGVLFNLITNLIFIPLYGYRAAAITTILSEWALLIPFYLLVRKNLCTVPWFDVAWRPTLAAGIMGAGLWLLGDTNFLVTVVAATVLYFGALALVGGFKQQDMSVVWRAVPLGRLLPRQVKPSQS